MLTRQMGELGIPAGELEITEILTEDQARRSRFPGSPTIRVGGLDVAGTDEAHYGLDCRLYLHRDGRPSPLPDEEDLREALERHARASK